MTCAACGASGPPGVSWCGRCFAVVAPVPAPAGRFVPAPDAPRAPPVHSRWRKTDTTFGPAGRVCWTVGMVLVLALFAFSANPFAIGGWLFIAMPLVLRSVWAAGRVS